MDIWSILLSFGIFYGHSVCFMIIWYIFIHFGMLYREKPGNPDQDINAEISRTHILFDCNGFPMTRTELLFFFFFFGGGSATPCASPPPPWPFIFSGYSFLVHHPVNQNDWQILAYAMASGLTIAWQFSQRGHLVFCCGSNSTPYRHLTIPKYHGYAFCFTSTAT
jgi:hypothetical protein